MYREGSGNDSGGSSNSNVILLFEFLVVAVEMSKCSNVVGARGRFIQQNVLSHGFHGEPWNENSC